MAIKREPQFLRRSLDPLQMQFEQVNPAAGERGSGIGLTLSKQLAEHMGGTLTVESQVGVGSRFTLWIPTGGERESREGWIG